MTLLEMVLPPNFDGTLRIKVDPSATSPTLTLTPSAAPATASDSSSIVWPSNVETMLSRMEKNPRTKTWPHRDIASHLKDAGFTPEAQPAGKAYIKWHVDGVVRGLTVYQEGSCLVVDSKPLLAFVLELEGAKKSPGERPRVQWTYGASVDAALGAASSLRAYADQE